MPRFLTVIPFLPSDNNYRLVVPLSGLNYLFDVHWNSRDSAWFIDLYEEDETPIVTGLKLVLGTALGRYSTHDFFKSHVLQLTDTSGADKDAGYDDLGARVLLYHVLLSDIGA